MLTSRPFRPWEILIGFQPAGKMETFFQEAAKTSDFAADEQLYRALRDGNCRPAALAGAVDTAT
jgi:hypothetical protein